MKKTIPFFALLLVFQSLGCGHTSSQNSTTASTIGGASFYGPFGIALDGASNAYVVDRGNHLIRQVNLLTGVVTTFAGTGSAGSTDGTGTAASFSTPSGITIDPLGLYLYVADTGNHLIRKIVISTGVVTTYAGSGTAGASNGSGTAASFSSPSGVTADTTGNVYVADTDNHLIREIAWTTRLVTTIAGDGSQGASDNVSGLLASFDSPSAITTDSSKLYIADNYRQVIRKISIASTAVTTLAGNPSPGSADGTGSSASFYDPSGVTIDNASNVYVADTSNHLIRKITPGGVVTTVAGSGLPGSTDGTGTAASFNRPYGITIDSTSENLYIADTGNNRIRKIILSTGAVTTVAGNGTQGSRDSLSITPLFSTPFMSPQSYTQ